MSSSPLALLLAGPHDRPALARLAALDSAPPLREPALLAYREGLPVAALSLVDGRAVGDPFEHSAEVVELLRLRARQLDRGPHRTRAAVARLRPAILQLR